MSSLGTAVGIGTVGACQSVGITGKDRLFLAGGERRHCTGPNRGGGALHSVPIVVKRQRIATLRGRGLGMRDIARRYRRRSNLRPMRR